MTATAIPARPGALNWMLLALLGLVWGMSFVAVTVGLEGFGPITIAAGRITIGAVLLLIAAFATGVGLPRLTDRHVWLHCLSLALFTSLIPFSLLGWGQQSVTSGFAGISMAVIPLIVLPLAWIFLQEAMTLRRTVGFMMGFVGTVTLIGPGALISAGTEAETLARLACLGAAMCYAIGSVITRTAPSVPLVSFSAAGLTIAAVIILPIAIWLEGLPEITLRPGLAILYLGVFPTAVATMLWVKVIKSAGPSFMSLVNYHVPFWAVVIGMLFLSEPLPARFLVALALILIGLAIAQGRTLRFRP